MVLIAWKVVGQDVLGLGVGLLVFIIGVILLAWSFKKTCLPLKVCIKDEGWFKAKEYKIIEVDSEMNAGLAISLHGLSLFALICSYCSCLFYNFLKTK
jgi:hypothetical protein